MKKLLIKDKKNRQGVNKLELKRFILKQICTNSNFLKTIQWNAIFNLSKLKKKNSKTVLSNRCISTINKKRFNKTTNFSRMKFLTIAKLGNISFLRKSSW